MKTKFAAVVLGLVVLAAGCVSTVSGSKTAGVPFVNDTIEARYERPMDEGGGETSTFPFEDWRYRYIEGIGQEIIIEFVDTCMCGEYHMTIDRSEKDALLYTPNAGLTMWEQMGMANK